MDERVVKENISFWPRELLEELKLSSPLDYKNYLRMDPTTFGELLVMVTPLIQKQDTILRDAISPKQRLFGTLRYLASGLTFEGLKFETAIAAETLGKIVIETCEAIVKVLKKYIKTNSNHKLPNNNSEPRMRKNENSASDQPDSGTSRDHNSTGSLDPRNNFKIGIYGWRKRCLYILILGLLVMVIINLALTLWVLKVMEFSSEGMGKLKIVTGGLRLEGKAFVLDSLIASSIRSRTGQPIVLESSRNLTLTTRDENGLLENLIYLGNDRFECLANNFKIMDDRGNVLFSANDEEVMVGAQVLRVSGKAGTMFSGSVQTPIVRADSGHNLRLESPTRSLEIRAPSGVNIESRAGDIKTISLNDISLKSVAGEIRLESSSVLMPGLPTAIPTTRAGSQLRNNEIFQLCACNNGKLFLAPSLSICAAEESGLSTPCR